MLEHCLEEYCLQKFLDDAEWEERFCDSFEEIPDGLYETLKKILANIEDYHEHYNFIYDV